jgi:hypothetical protein
MKASFVALARARGRLLRKRYGNGLSVVSLIVFSVILFYVGDSIGGALLRKKVAATFFQQSLGATIAALALAFGFAFSWALKQSLYQARELTILLAQPVSVRGFVLWRSVEALGMLSVMGLLAFMVLLGLFQGAKELVPWGGVLISLSSLMFMELGLALGLAALLQRLSGRGFLGVLLSLALSVPFFAPLLFSVLGQGSLNTLGPLEYFPGGSQGVLLQANAGAVSIALSVVWALLFPALGFALACFDFDGLRDRAVGFPKGKPGLSAYWPRYLVRVFPKPVRGLLQRDFYLLIRGSFFRGLLVLGLLTLLPLIFRGLLQDESLELWAIEFMTLLVFVVLTSATSFLCAADFPQHRRRQVIFEKAQPLTGRQVLWSRTLLGFLLSLPYAIAIVYFLVSHARVNVSEMGLEVGFKGIGLMACLCHYGAVMGLKAEQDSSGAEGMAFPIIMGMLGMFLAFLVKIHWIFLVVYPFVQGQASEQAGRLYEFSEVSGGAEP